MTRTPRTVLIVLVSLLVGAGAVVGLGFVALQAFNPVADEYVCSEGEVPGGPAPVAPGEGNQCFAEGDLPRGVEADPLGNRPLSFNCDKDDYRVIEKTEGRGAGQVLECVADDTEVPAGWRVAEEG